MPCKQGTDVRGVCPRRVSWSGSPPLFRNSWAASASPMRPHLVSGVQPSLVSALMGNAKMFRCRLPSSRVRRSTTSKFVRRPPAPAGAPDVVDSIWCRTDDTAERPVLDPEPNATVGDDGGRVGGRGTELPAPTPVGGCESAAAPGSHSDPTSMSMALARSTSSRANLMSTSA